MLLGASVLGAAKLFGVADEHSGVERVAAGGFFEFRFVVVGTFTEIYYEFRVESGPAVDVYLLTEADFSRYLAGLPLVDFSNGSMLHEGIVNVTGSPYPPEGTYHAVVDNTNYGLVSPDGQEARVSYLVDAGGFPGPGAMFMILLFALAGLLLFGGLVVVGMAAFDRRTSSIGRSPRYCPYCGSASGRWICPRCGKPYVPTRGPE